jgi:ABC-2 type transport system permease protein
VSLNKILAVAEAEFRAMVRSKAFLISIVVLPVLMLGMSLAQKQISARADTSTRRFAVLDTTGRYYDDIAAAAQARNAELGAASAHKMPRPPFEPERVELAGRSLDAVRLELSERVRKEQLFAFVEIPAEPDRDKLRYYSDHPAYDDLHHWLSKTLDDKLRSERYRQAHLEPPLIAALSRHVEAETMGLWTRDADGHVHPAEKQDEFRAIVVPMVPMFLLFFFVVTAVPQMMNSVLTEKTSRISEVLLGSLSPTELMTGKLLGSVAVSLLLGVIYLSGGITVAARMGYAGAIAPSLIVSFLVFLVLAMLLYGSVSMAVGAACNDVKDAQNLMLPVMLPLMMPMLVMGPVIESPSSALSVGMSLFPPATPLVMLLRVGLHPAPPVWQVALGIGLTLLTTAACVWAAGRIFRVGLLMQGKSASLGQMVRWIFSR